MSTLTAYEAETALVGACMLSKSHARRLTQTVPAVMFAKVANRLLWERITQLAAQNAEADMVGLKPALVGEMTESVAEDWIIHCGEFVPSPANADFYGSEVRNAWMRREFQRIGELSGTADFDPIAAMAETRKIATLAENQTPEYGSWSDFIRDGSKAEHSIPTGFTMLDKQQDCSGLALGQTGVVLAGTGAGKTWALLQMAKHASDQGYRVLYGTFADLSAEDLASRIMKISCGYGSKASADRDGRLEDWENAKSYAAISGTLDIYDGSRKRHGGDVMRFLDFIEERQGNKASKYDVIFADYAQKLTSSEVKRGDSYEMADVCAGHVRRFAGEFNLPFWVGSQASMTPEGLLMTKGNRVWEEDAGLVLEIVRYRQKYQKLWQQVPEEIRCEGITRASLRKSRHGRDHVEEWWRFTSRGRFETTGYEAK